MRLNKFLSDNTDLSRRKADGAIASRQVYINDRLAMLGDQVGPHDVVFYNGKKISPKIFKRVVILLNKPVGYVCSHDGQGSKTIYDLLPTKFSSLNPAGRLDKDSSGLVILTNDGELLNQLTHPSKSKDKVYEIELISKLTDVDIAKLTSGVDIGDERPSKFKSVEVIDDKSYRVILQEGRNRQIRRTISALDNKVVILKRTAQAEFNLDNIEIGKFTKI